MRKTISLMKNWQFVRLDRPVQTPPKLDDNMLSTVSLPHVWNKDTPADAGCCLYQCRFPMERPEEHCYFLVFEAVAGVARVFLNGAFLGEHRGSYSRFAVDAREALKSGENLLQVLADNTRYEDVNPLMGDFTYWGGIYRDVSLVETDMAHFDLLYFGTPGLEILEAGRDGLLRLNARICAPGKCTVEYLVTDSEGALAAQCRTDAVSPGVELKVLRPRLWQGKDDPYLYRCTARLWRGGELADEISLPFGFRDAEISAQKGFLLNGTPLRLNGVAKHQDFAGAGCAPSEEQLDQDFALISEVGANAIRLSHYQHPQYAYDLCDQLGYITWAEIPMLSMPEGNTAVVENAAAQLAELIVQNRHHPAICFWGVQNEIAMMGEHLGMYRDVERLNAVVKDLDPTRISAAANLYCVKNNSSLNFLNDAVGYNIYFGWYYGELKDYAAFLEKFHADNPDVPLGVTEYGVDCNLAYHTDNPECKDYTEEFQCLFHENAYAAIQADRLLWGSFVWNMFDFSSAIRDEGGVKARNSKGLVTYDRETRKDAFYFYKAVWSETPFVHLTGRRYRNRCGETVTVKVYSNLPEVALYVNGVRFGTQTGKTSFMFEHIPLRMGGNTLRAESGHCRDEMELCRVTEPDQSYTYPLKGQGSKVSNWFARKNAAVDLFPEGCYSISDRIGDLLADPWTRAVLEAELPDIVSNPRARTMGGMTLMRILDYNADTVTQEQAMKVNAQLNAIPK